MTDERIGDVEKPSVSRLLERVGRLLWEMPVGVKLRWLPDPRYLENEHLESVEQACCLYLGRNREREVSLVAPKEGRWLLTVEVVCPADGYVRKSGATTVERVKLLRVRGLQASDRLTFLVGRGEFGFEPTSV